MNKVVLLIQLILFTGAVNSQSELLIDSLKTSKENKIIVFKTNCVGCIVLNNPCDQYAENGNPWNEYVIWKNSNGYNVKKYNNCGNSGILTLKKWNGNPFEIITLKSKDLDTLTLRYPLSYDRNDSTWYDTEINHYKYYDFTFLTDSIRSITIKDYAFREQKEDDSIRALYDFEFKRNLNRYEFNNAAAVKELLDVLIEFINENDKKLKIINANLN